MTDIELVVKTLSELGRLKAESIREKVVAKEIDDTELIDNEDYVPEWKQMDYTNVAIGTPVRDPFDDSGQVYKLWQQHDATNQPDWHPAAAVSLWDIAHTKNPDKAKPYVEPQGTRGMYMKDEVMVWTDGKTYRSTADNNVYTPETYAQWWEVVE